MENKTVLNGLLHATKPLNKWQSNKLGNEIKHSLNSGRGASVPFRYAVGAPVKDINTSEGVMVISECYRQNGYNKYATKQGFYREQDLQPTN